MDLSERIDGFAKLGDYLKESLLDVKEMNLSGDCPGEIFFRDYELLGASKQAQKVNPWFIPGFIHYALTEIARILTRDVLVEWTKQYPPEDFHPTRPLAIGTILAGNIPAVGFHDFLSILLSGNHFKGKSSGKSKGKSGKTDSHLPFFRKK